MDNQTWQYWKSQAKNDKLRTDQRLLAWEQAYNHLENALAADREKVERLESENARLRDRWEDVKLRGDHITGPWPEEAKNAIAAIEEQYDIEVVSMGHHVQWVEREERLREQLRKAEDERDKEIHHRDSHRKSWGECLVRERDLRSAVAPFVEVARGIGPAPDGLPMVLTYSYKSGPSEPTADDWRALVAAYDTGETKENNHA